MRTALRTNKFKTHNNKSEELVASKFHSTLQNVRIVINTGIDKATGKPISGKQAHFTAVFVNNQSHWRTIASGGAFKGTKSFGSYLKAIEVAATSGPTCKCGAKKFKAKSGNVVCANACWTRWAGRSDSNAAPKAPAPKKVWKRLTRRTAPLKKRVQGPDPTHYFDIRVGQLVKLIDLNGHPSPFVGTVIKVTPVSGRPHDLLNNIDVQWMHNGNTERLSNYYVPGAATSRLQVVA